MGTRATITIYDQRYHRKIVQIYHHYDGYPEHLGEKLKKYLSLTSADPNAYPGQLHQDFNGVGCFAASLIAHLKECPGNVYVEPTDTTHGDTEYHYTISYRNSNDIHLTVETLSHSNDIKTLFERSPE